MKKFISILLALMLVMSLGTAAFADVTIGDKDYTDASNANVEKVFKLENDGTTSPEVTFTLAAQNGGYPIEITDGPLAGDYTAETGAAAGLPCITTVTGAHFVEGAATVEGAKENIVITLPSFSAVGVYTFMLNEVEPETNKPAGVTYNTQDIKLVVTVVNDEPDGFLRVAAVHTETSEGVKNGSFTNMYKASGDGKNNGLSVKKVVDGAFGDHTKYFEFNITLDGLDDTTYAENGYKLVGGSDYVGADGSRNPEYAKVGDTTTVYLKHEDTIRIENLPYDVRYSVAETADTEYTTTYSDNSAGTIDGAEHAVVVTNTAVKTNIDTGISLDSLPYILMLVVVGAAIVVVSTRKKGEQF